MNGMFTPLDEAVERVTRRREQLLTDVEAPDRATRLAQLFESEARLWSQLFDFSSLRLVCRAALAAEALARHNTRVWRRRADEVAPKFPQVMSTSRCSTRSPARVRALAQPDEPTAACCSEPACDSSPDQCARGAAVRAGQEGAAPDRGGCPVSMTMNESFRVAAGHDGGEA